MRRELWSGRDSQGEGSAMKRSDSILVAAIVGLLAMASPSQDPRLTAPDVPQARGETDSRRAPMAMGTQDDPDARDAMEFMMLRDPLANAIPRDMRRREVRFATSLVDRRARAYRAGPNGADQIQ